MDPGARHETWTLLQAEKVSFRPLFKFLLLVRIAILRKVFSSQKQRTMLLTTHFMDEADLLGEALLFTMIPGVSGFVCLVFV